MTGGGEDRRVTRSREALSRALIELIVEKGFEKISVREITERANVGRSTFYVHYADKEDLLQGSVESMRRFLEAGSRLDAPQRAGVHPALAFCLPMLEHAHDQRELFSAMVGRQSGYLLQELVHDLWADLIRASWPGADEIAVQSISGAFGATLRWWLLTCPDLSPRTVERRFRQFVAPGLRGASSD